MRLCRSHPPQQALSHLARDANPTDPVQPLAPASARQRTYAVADGAIRWDIEKDVMGSSYNMGTAHVLRPDGKTPFLVLANGEVVRVADGMVVGAFKIANAGSEWGGVSVVGDGKDTVYFLPGRNGGGEMVAIRAVLENGTISRKDLWKAPHKNRSITPVLHEGLIYHSDDDKATVVRDAKTGETSSPCR